MPNNKSHQLRSAAVGHVFARLAGYGVVLVPRWPYLFEWHPDGADAVRLTHWAADGPRRVVLRPGQPIDGGDVVDITDGPDHDHWVVETSIFRLRWPAGFTVESSQDPDDRTPFYLHGPGEATIFPQGPIPNRQADPAAFVAAGQVVLDRRTWDDGTTIVELTYEHGGEPWWQGHWAVRYDEDRRLVITAQALRSHAAQTRTAVDQAVASLG